VEWGGERNTHPLGASYIKKRGGEKYLAHAARRGTAIGGRSTIDSTSDWGKEWSQQKLQKETLGKTNNPKKIEGGEGGRSEPESPMARVEGKNWSLHILKRRELRKEESLIEELGGKESNDSKNPTKGNWT